MSGVPRGRRVASSEARDQHYVITGVTYKPTEKVTPPVGGPTIRPKGATPS
jgi:hypothetical protein